MNKRFLLLLSVLLTSLMASAYDFKADGMYYNILSYDDLTCEVAKSQNYNYSGDVVIPSTVAYDGRTYSVIKIGDNAFYSCSAMTSVEIPNSITAIGEYAFNNCRGLTSIEIPNSVTTIGNETFFYCFGLTSVEIPNSVITIGEDCFYDCSGLTSVVIGNSVKTIGDDAFYCCTGITSISIGNSVTTIGIKAFAFCRGLTSVEIPNSVTTIESMAFDYCSGLTSVAIGNSVNSIKTSAFANCSELKEIVSFNPIPPTANIQAFYGVSKTDCVVKVPEGSVEAYKAAREWKDFLNIEVYVPTTVSGVQAADAQAQPVYNLAGQRVSDGTKGIVVKNGRKVLVK